MKDEKILDMGGAEDATPEKEGRQKEPAFTIGISAWMRLIKEHKVDHFEDKITRAFMGDPSVMLELK
jgi:hypothetical protein